MTGRGRPRATSAFGVSGIAGLLLCGACEPREDLVGVLLPTPARRPADAGAGSTRSSVDGVPAVVPPADGGRAVNAAPVAEGKPIVVFGRPATTWPFDLARWPLSQPLSAVFGSRDRVELVGKQAARMRRLEEAVARGEYGSPRRSVGVRDAAGSVYVLVFNPD